MSPALSRRRVLTGALAAAGALGLAGCAGGFSSGPPGRFRVAIAGGGSREQLDPHVLPQVVDQVRAKACYDTLVGYSPAMTPVPRLAESWESDATGTRWRIRLRPARFHDGRPVTATDVIASFRRIADPATGASAAQLFTDVDFAASRAVSDTEAEIVLRSPNRLFPISWGATGTAIVPGGRPDPTHPVGSGPFRFVSFSPGGPALYRAFEAYREGRPPSTELEIVPVDQENARAGALLSGQVHCAYDLQPTSVLRLTDDERAHVLSSPQGTSQYLCLKVDRPPFSDPRLRTAVQVGIDRAALVRVVLLGRGEIGNDLRGPGVQYYDTTIPQITRDLPRATALVTEAGARGTPVEILTSTTDPTFVPAATEIARQLTETGLDAQPRTIPPDSYFSQVRRTGVAAMTSGGPLPIPDYVGRKLVTNGTPNYTGYRNPQIDALYAQAVATPDEAERVRAFSAVQQLFHGESGNLVWGIAGWNVGVAADVRGVEADEPNTDRWGMFDRAVAA
ncbi:ABC transporter substrate-binding protein [Actinomycetospora endophytica]|uniref:ABC transporter substrate-binding protein n=1 Tax=Actinomycetospora endophytica TaxID=2291215 RepID=A0ABS8PGJ1_9PSEU|nr:ABC transporter substrate-binding protein [Actinomycetospora endophytica]MCD2197376.1 ABC transporter substrate-binding protein [Actinomycetospora endophytica]